jgi:hypothetical protein
VDDFGTVLFVLGFGNPLGGEGSKGALNGTTSPYRVVSVGRGDDFGVSSLWAESSDFFL